MKVTPTNGPVIQANTNPNATQASQDAKARAIAKLTSQQAPIPVDPNNISAEEITAVKPQAKAPVQEAGQKDTVADTQTEEVKPKEETASNQYVLLARKEKALRLKAQQQDQAFKTREAELVRREAELASKQPNLDEYIPKSKLKQNALAVLNEEGISYDEITQQQIDAGQVPQAVQAHIQRLEARLAKQEQALEDAKKGAEAQQGEAYQAAIKQIRSDAQSLVKADPNFEMIRATNSINDVVELIEATFKEEGRVMSVEDAAQEVEEHLVAEIDKLTRLEKIKKRMTAQPAAEKSSDEQIPQTKQPQTMKTLTNATSSQRQLSAKERAILAFRGELKS